MHHMHYVYVRIQYVVGHSTCHMNADVQKDVVIGLLPSNISQILHGIHKISYRTVDQSQNSQQFEKGLQWFALSLGSWN